MNHLSTMAMVAILMIALSCSDNSFNKEMADGQTLLSDSLTDASCVFLASDERGAPVVSWVEIDSEENKRFYFSKWDVHSNKFGSRIAIPIAENTSIHEEGMPKIAIKGDGTIVATYETSVPSDKSRFGLSDIIYISSPDQGQTWSEPRSIQAGIPQSGSRSFGNMARLDDGEVGMAWLDYHPGAAEDGRPVKFAKTNEGNGFGDAVLIEPSACQCCRTAISSDGKGNVAVVFRDLLSGSVRDISVSKSLDNGKTFSAPVSFSKDNWVVDGCPHNGPSLISKDNKSYVAWFTGSDRNGVFYGELDDGNNMLVKRRLDANGRFVQLCLMPDGSRIAAYNKNYKDGDSMYSKIMVTKVNNNGFFDKEVTLPHAHASFPMIHPLDQEKIVVAWSDKKRVYYRLLNAASIKKSKVY